MGVDAHARPTRRVPSRDAPRRGRELEGVLGIDAALNGVTAQLHFFLRQAELFTSGDEEAAGHPDVGEWVTVSPTDTGKVPVTGTLVGMDSHHIILLRRSDDVGDIHVHFPAEGFECMKIN